MITIESFAEVPTAARGGILTIGNFDGVHRGHSHLLGRLRARADAAGAPAIALTFNPHPVALLRPDKAPVPLVWPEREVSLLRVAGADEVGVFRTGPWLLGLSAREFFDRVIVGQFQARGLVEGPNFAFGKDRGGDTTMLARWCAEAGLEFEVVEPTAVDGGLVSSTRIRNALVAGHADEAARLLGRPHRIRGTVVHGAARGAQLGFPTANLEGIDTLIPADGVYAGLAYVEPGAPGCPAALHIGPNATFGERARNVEAHLIGYAGDLYGRTIELDLLQQIRPTRRFDRQDDLLAQIRADVTEVGAVCARSLSSR